MRSLQKNKIFSLAALSLMLFSYLLLAVPHSTSAAEQGTWTDNSTVNFRNATYKDRGGDNSESLIREGDPGVCVKSGRVGVGSAYGSNMDEAARKKMASEVGKTANVIRDFSGSNRSSANHITLKIGYYSASRGRVLSDQEFRSLSPRDVNPALDQIDCNETSKVPISLTQATSGAVNAEFTWRDSGFIERTDGSRLYKKDASGKFVWESDGNSCQEYLRPASSTKATLYYDGSKNVGGQCNYKSKEVALGGTENMTKAAGTGTTKSGTETSQNEASDGDKSCESKGGVMGWLLCPVILITDSALNWVDTQIQALLEVDKTMYDNDGLKSAWVSIRNIAYIILVPIMLVMVVGTALGFDFVSAYTVKRVLPRLVAAVIFITLSFVVCTFLIELFNAIGQGTLGLLTSPFRFKNASGVDITVSSLSLADLFGGSIFTSMIALPVVTIGVILAIWLFGTTLLLFAAIAFLVLLLRQIFIIALIMLAPLAILVWIFPGNDTLWKSWRSLFTKLLIMFPLIMAIIAVGRIFAVIIAQGGGGGLQGSILNPLMKLAAYMLPYALIPFTFKFAGGVFATVAGLANDRSKGLFDRQKQARANKVERMARGNIFRGAREGSFGDKINQASKYGMNVRNAGLRPSLMRSNMATAVGAQDFDAASEFLEKNAAARAIKGDDDKMWAAQNGNSVQDVRKILRDRAPERFADEGVLNNAVSEVMRFKREGGDKVSRIAATMAQAGTGTGFNYRGDGLEDDMLDAVIATSGSDRGLAGRMLATMRQSAMQSGRVDLAGGGFAKQAQVMDKRREAMANKGYIAKRDDDGNIEYGPDGRPVMVPYRVKEARQEILADVLQSNAGAAVAGKVEGVRQLAPVMKANVDAAFLSNDATKAARELAKLAGKYDAASQIAPQNAEALADLVLSQDIDVKSLPGNIRTMLTEQTDPRTGIKSYDTTIEKMSYQTAIEKLRSNPDFVTMRREYQSSGVAAAEAQSRAVQGALGGQPAGTPTPIVPPPPAPGP